MASPSPLDRCWIVKDSNGSSPIMPAVRAAVERHWLDTQRAAASVLGDEALAAEIMEGAIEQAVAYLADHPPKNQEDVSAVLSRFSRQEVGRRRKKSKRFVFIDFSVAPEASGPYFAHSAVDAAIDAERILADAPPRVREAMMMRYGSSESWATWRPERRRTLKPYERNARGVSNVSDKNWEFGVLRSKLRQRYFRRPGRIPWTSINHFLRMMTTIHCSLRSFRSTSSKNTLILNALAVSTTPL